MDTADKYVGEWKSDKMEGKGILTWAKGRGTYSGDWKDNSFNGKGFCKWPDGRQYEGEWVSDKRHGRGFYRFGDGKIFEGDFEKDLPRKGLLVERDGNSFLMTYTGWTAQSAWFPATKKRVGKLDEGLFGLGETKSEPVDPKTQKKATPSQKKTSEPQLPKCIFVWDNCNSLQYQRFEGTRVGLCPKEGVLIKNDGMFKVIYEGKATFAEAPSPTSSVGSVGGRSG